MSQMLYYELKKIEGNLDINILKIICFYFLAQLYTSFLPFLVCCILNIYTVALAHVLFSQLELLCIKPVSLRQPSWKCLYNPVLFYTTLLRGAFKIKKITRRTTGAKIFCFLQLKTVLSLTFCT